MAEQFTFFWRHILGQWTRSKFVVDDVEYCCAEQYMMAEKARLFKDEATLAKILESTDPKTIKRLGRDVTPYDEEQWNAVAKDVVYRGNYAKFTQNPSMMEVLMATGDTTLVEASPYDKKWGVGLAEDNPLINDRATWRGSNWLGEVLTRLRDDLKAENGQ